MRAYDRAMTDELKTDYRNVFGSEPGRRVLAHILFDLGYFSGEISDDEGRIRCNLATRLIQRCGSMDDDTAIRAFFNGLFIAPLDEPTTDKENTT